MDLTFGHRVPFTSLGLREELIKSLEEKGRPVATHIQALSIPLIKEGKDVVLGSETGGGKTLAYLLPLLDRYLFPSPDDDPRGPHAIVLVPNRQLADQVLRMAKEILLPLLPPEEARRVILGFVGRSLDWPFHDNMASPRVLVCTPASLSIFHRDIDLFTLIDTLVLDEADMLLEGDYGRHLDNILVAFRRADKEKAANGTKPPTQYILSAATIPTYGLKSVEEMVSKRFPTATRVSTEVMHKHHPRLHQSFIQVPEALDAKMPALLKALTTTTTSTSDEEGEGGGGGKGKQQYDKTMVFTNTAQGCIKVYELLQAAGVPCVPFHKELGMEERAGNLLCFRLNEVPILVCTDLAARGLDIPDVKHVVQAEFATNVVQHLHRIGRAVRAGREGRATNLYDKSGEDLVESLQVAGEESLDRSFSRQRGFRKKVKKYGKEYYRSPKPKGGGGGGGGTSKGPPEGKKK